MPKLAPATSVVPLSYALMTSKSEECNIKMLEGLCDFAQENGIDLQPNLVITDFELAAINAVSRVFPEVVQKGCLFHLGQSIWRRV